MEFKVAVAVAVILLCFTVTEGNKKKNNAKKKDPNQELEELREKVQTLWDKVHDAPAPVQVHVHGTGLEDVHEEEPDTEKGAHVHVHLHVDPHNEEDLDHGHDHKGLLEDDGYLHAQCNIHPNSGTSKDIKGSVFLRQKPHKPLEIKVAFTGFDVSGDDVMHEHGFHVHQYGDLKQGCTSLGTHFNPDGTNHGAQNAIESRHAGDWGNIHCDENGNVNLYMKDNNTSLIGTHSILGRGIVIHETSDDLGLGGKPDSLKTGAAGGRLACCVVVRHPKVDWGEVSETISQLPAKPHHHVH